MKNIKLTVHLWTNDLPADADCWNVGQVSVQKSANPSYNLHWDNAVLFNRPDDMHTAMMKSLSKAGVSVALSARGVK